MLKLNISADIAQVALRLATAMLMLLSVGYVVFEQAIFRVDALIPQISSLLLVMTLVALLIHTKSSDRQGKSIVVISVVYWAMFVALFTEPTSPTLIVSSFLALLLTVYVDRLQALAGGLFLVLSSQVGYILSDQHSDAGFLFITLHACSLILIVLVGGVYHSKVRHSSDIEDLKTEEANVERERLQALINSMTDGVIATDTDGKVVVYNGSALDILNMNASLEGRQTTEFLNVLDKAGEKVPVMEMAQKQQGYLVSRDYMLSQDDIQSINLYISISPVKLGFGHEGAEGYIMLLRDITREKSLEEERDEFVSVVSHELRTPITIAEGNISNAEVVLEKGSDMKAIKQSLDAAHKQVIFLSEMINDLATLSRAERGKLQSAPENIDVHDLVRSLQSDYRSSAQQKGVIFNTSVDKEVGAIFSSRLYVREILQNFITNAIKYTPDGDVNLTVIQVGSRVEFSIKDSGIGISKTDQKHLFKKFFRSEDYRTRENSGTGLGLYVTMKLAKLINAQIGVTSELNEGSTFTVTVPSMKGHAVEIG